MVCDPWPVTKLGCRKDSVLEAARLPLRARNTELVSTCNKIILLPASGNVHGVQGSSRERSLYSLHAPSIEPFKVHMWQIPAIRTCNRTTWSWVITPGKIMVRRGQKSDHSLSSSSPLESPKGRQRRVICAPTSDVGGLSIPVVNGSRTFQSISARRSTRDGGLSMALIFYNFLPS